MSTVYLNRAANKLILSFEYNQHLVDQVKKIPGCRWNKQISRWEAPLGQYERIIEALDNIKVSQAVIEWVAEEAAIRKKVKFLQSDAYFELTDYTPKLPLMSHQKKAFELHRTCNGSGNMGEMGSGKCLISTDAAMVYGELVQMEKLWELYATDALFDGTGWWATPRSKIEICSLEKDGKISKRQVHKLYRQKVNEKLLRVTLDDGSSTTITKAHKLYSSNVWTNDLTIGKTICVPNKIPHESGTLDVNVAELMGWMVGDGCDSDLSKNRHRFTQKEDSDRYHVKDLIEYVCREHDIAMTITETPPNATHPAASLDFCSADFRKLFESFGYKWGRLSAFKEVPTAIMRGNKDVVAAFLQGYFDAEGYVWSERYTIEVSSASHLMMKQVSLLLRRFGIWLRLRKKRARATNGKNIWRDYWVGTIGGPSARLFCDEIGFSVNYKQEALEKFKEVVANSNVEGVPAYQILKEIVDKTNIPIRHITDSYTIYLSGTQEPSRKTLQQFIKNIDKILDGRKETELYGMTDEDYLTLLRVNKESTSYARTANQLNSLGILTKYGKTWNKATVMRTIAVGRTHQYKDIYDNIDKVWLKQKRDELQKLIDQEVHYATIVSIEEIDYEGWVYDLEVPETHNYVAENILCHNTASAICALHWYIETGKTKHCLVVCPKSVMKSWEEQITMFSDMTYISLEGTKEERLKKLKQDKHIYLINYEGVWRMEEDLLKKGFNAMLCDEAHRIKNPQSKQSKSCYTIGDSVEYRIALTGSPVLNTPMDAFGVMRFIDSTVFGESFYAFRNKYFLNVGNENSPIPIFVPRHGAEKEISDKLYTRAVRVLKEECLDLPQAVHAPNRIVNLSPEQDKAYRALQEKLSAEIAEAKQIKISHVLTLMLKLNQITSGWIKDPETGEIYYFKSNPKFDELIEVVEECGKQPIIIWAYYKADMSLITNYFGRCTKCKEPVNYVKKDNCPKCKTLIKYRCSEVQGSTKHRYAEIAKFRFTPEERAQQRKKYLEEGQNEKYIREQLGDLLEDGSEPPQTNIIVNQCVAASEGLNLQRSTVSIFYSRNWSLKDWTQALARNHRAGQTKSVTYINLVAQMANGEDTVDQRIVDALQKKEDLSKRINKDDLKLLSGNFKKKDKEAFKDVAIQDDADAVTDAVVDDSADANTTIPDIKLNRDDVDEDTTSSEQSLLF